MLSPNFSTLQVLDGHLCLLLIVDDDKQLSNMTDVPDCATPASAIMAELVDSAVEILFKHNNKL